MFTQEEIIAAKSVRDTIIKENVSELKSVYMAGEIVMYEQIKTEMFENMQYYMEYCSSKGYVTPQEWIAKHKHF